MPSINKVKSDHSPNGIEISHDAGQKLNTSIDPVSQSYLFGNHSFQPTLKAIAPNKFSIFQNRKETYLNSSYRDISYHEIYGSPRKLKLENSDDYLQRLRLRKKSIKPHYSPQNEPLHYQLLKSNVDSQKKIIENVIDDIKFNMKQIKKQEQLQKPQLKNAQVHNFYFQKNMRQIYPFQIEKCVRDMMHPIQVQREHLLSPIQTEKSLIYPMRPKVKKHPKFLEKIKKRMLLRKKTIFLPQIQIYQDPIVRKLKHFQKSIFQNQCIHMMYIRPSAIRVQKYMIDDPKNEEIIKKCFSYRWWWKEKDENDDEVQFYWNSKPCSDFLNKQRARHISDKIEYQPFEEILSNLEDVEDQMKFAIEQKLCLLSPFIKTHNHIELSESLWTKKILVNQMTQFYQYSGISDAESIPQSIIVENLADLSFYDFLQNNKQTTDLWVVEKCEKADGINIKICENAKSVFNFIHLQYQVPSRKQQTFIIQKYIRTFAYFQEKLDMCYFLLVTQINGIVRGYLFEQFYGEKSHLKFSPFNEKKPYETNDDQNKDGDSQIVSMELIIDQLNQNSADYYYDIFPSMQELVKDYLKSIFIKMPVKDHNFELLKVVFIIDQQYKPWLINVKPIQAFPNEPDLQKDMIPLLIDNTIQLTLDVLFPSPLIWVKEKKKMIELYPEKNDFSMVFDSRLDAQGLKSLFDNQTQEPVNEEEF